MEPDSEASRPFQPSTEGHMTTLQPTKISKSVQCRLHTNLCKGELGHLWIHFIEVLRTNGT
jgi:hypothetical protein